MSWFKRKPTLKPEQQTPAPELQDDVGRLCDLLASTAVRIGESAGASKLRPTRWNWRNPSIGMTSYEGRYDQHEELEPLIHALVNMQTELRFDPKDPRDAGYAEVLRFTQGVLNSLSLTMDEWWHRQYGASGPRRKHGYSLTSMSNVNAEDSAAIEEMKRLHRRDWERSGFDPGVAHCVFCEGPNSFSGRFTRKDGPKEKRP